MRTCQDQRLTPLAPPRPFAHSLAYLLALHLVAHERPLARVSCVFRDALMLALTVRSRLRNSLSLCLSFSDSFSVSPCRGLRTYYPPKDEMDYVAIRSTGKLTTVVPTVSLTGVSESDVVEKSGRKPSFRPLMRVTGSRSYVRVGKNDFTFRRDETTLSREIVGRSFATGEPREKIILRYRR